MKIHELSVGYHGNLFLATSGFAQTTLKEAFKNDFLIGAALNEAEFTGRNTNAVATRQGSVQHHQPGKRFEMGIHPSPAGSV